MAAGDTQITIAGNLVEDPVLRSTQQGQPVASFRVASVPRFFDKQANEWRDGEGLFLTVNVWRQQAENVCETLVRGSRVIVTGRLKQRTYETKEGDKRTVLEVEADDVGRSLRNASTKANKVIRSCADSGSTRSPAVQNARGGADDDPRAAEALGGHSDAPPF